ncbi:O-antigen/teichoic acid export membrane protein [Anaerobacterium chartisolvens]|uniref:O-antigen/teichoic acid export membrane protein n=2 Tax=Anaerobacterium chartisolvens TaxID=1297424 RepID=A0A369BF52_9FIRM|nr:O-antigen/teichoic acid export membrane protein [Anaerobacterium chartisolvens]
MTQQLVKSISQRVVILISDGNIKKFFSSLGVVFIFRFTTAALNMVSIALTVRYIGVAAMGDITMVQNAGYLLVIPIVSGINYSIIKYLPQCGIKERNEFIVSAFLANISVTALLVLAYISASELFCKITGFSTDKWVLSIIFAAALNFSMVMESVLRSQKMFFRLSCLKMVGSLFFFAIVLVCGFIMKSFYYFVIAMIINQCVFAILAFRDIKIERMGFSMKAVRLIYSYGAINMVSWILSYALFSTDIFIVGHYCSAYDVGLYSLYHTNVRNFFNIMFHEVFAVVFLPTIAEIDKMKVYRKIIGLIPLLLPFSVLANAAFSIVMYFMYGGTYEFNWLYIGIVSISTGFHSIYWMLNSAFTVEGKRGAVLCLWVVGVPLPLLLAATVWITKSFGITGAMVSSLIAQLVLIGMFILTIKRLYLKYNISAMSPIVKG